MNRHRYFLGFTMLGVLGLGLLLMCGQIRVATRSANELPALRQLVGSLQLTDLALWTEARYTRNPSQADRFTPYQDFPSALEHFPAGSIMAPQDPGQAARSRLP